MRAIPRACPAAPRVWPSHRMAGPTSRRCVAFPTTPNDIVPAYRAANAENGNSLARGSLGAVTIATVLLTGCASTNLSDFTDQRPEMLPEKFFVGELRGWGVENSPFGRIGRRIEVEATGISTWQPRRCGSTRPIGSTTDTWIIWNGAFTSLTRVATRHPRRRCSSPAKVRRPGVPFVSPIDVLCRNPMARRLS